MKSRLNRCSESTGPRRAVVLRVAAMLALFASAGAQSAAAAVIYVDLVPDHVWFKPYFLDVDSDGTPDLLFDHDFGCVGNCLSFASLGGLTGEILMSDPENVTAMAAGVIVGPAASTFGTTGLLARDRFFGDPPVYLSEEGLWDNGLRAFAGFRFSNASGVHYGWVQVQVDETSNDITVFDFAYEDRPDTAIAAGAVPEPGTMALMLMAACGLAACRRRFRPL
jgi:hypothetical protein